MPLSEEELRLLEQMERALVEEDPKFASTLRGTSLRRSARRRAALAGAVFVVGIVVLMTGVISQLYLVGIVGFVIMLVSAIGMAPLLALGPRAISEHIPDSWDIVVRPIDPGLPPAKVFGERPIHRGLGEFRLARNERTRQTQRSLVGRG